MMKRFLWSAGSSVAVLALFGCMRAATAASTTGTPPQQSAQAPRLVVFITVDQLRGDMLDRYSKDLRYGYARLMKGGAWFVNGYQDHANTETAPGHASTMSGRFPRSTGIFSNATGVNTRDYPMIEVRQPQPGASPDRFVGTTLFDWIKAKTPATRALSVSRKDRGAILPIGKAKADVYWYAPEGAFTTSTYYRDSLPGWVRAFNARRLPHSYAGKQWALSRDAATYTEPDTVAEENGGRSFFPFQISPDTARATGQLAGTPAIDSITALFALEGVKSMGLGTGPQTDVLAVSFSATDAVGHTYGPDSREAHENEIRLDETLGWFLDSLFALRGEQNILIALTADHGVQPIPELARRRGEATGNQGLIVSLAPVVASIRAGLAAVGVDTMAFVYEGELAAVNREALSAAKLNPDSVLDAFKRGALAVPGVARVDRLRDMYRANHTRDPIARRWAHQVLENAPYDLVITLTRYSYWYRATATHGSPYDQDAHVPIMFYGSQVKPGRYTTFARTVDMAPTLARIIGVTPTEKLDGVPLTQAIR
jgi:predicted AlkP superfamily pyrophosphatase or phosphodiesterase